MFGCASHPSLTGQEDMYTDNLCQGDTGFLDIKQNFLFFP